jgi:hypothetical protein
MNKKSIVTVHRVYFVSIDNIVTCIFIARQRLVKHTPQEANARDNRTHIARQRISKRASLTVEAVYSAWSVQSGYKEVFGSIEQQSSRE